MEPTGYGQRQHQFEAKLVGELGAMCDALVRLSLTLHDLWFEASMACCADFKELASSASEELSERINNL